MTEKTKVLKLSPKEALKSLRDIVVPTIAGLIPQILEIVELIDFGENTIYVSIGLAMISPLANRLLNLWRV